MGASFQMYDQYMKLVARTNGTMKISAFTKLVNLVPVSSISRNFCTLPE